MTAERYTHGHHPSVLASHARRTAQNSAAYLIDRLAPGTRLLDVGCGPGSITADLADLTSPGEVIGIDSEPAVVAAAAENHPRPNLRYAVGDVHDLGATGDSFDVVHAHQVLQHLSDPVEALRQMAAVTRPGGLVAVRDADYSAMAFYPEEPGMIRFFEIYQQVARLNGAEPDAGRRLPHWMRQAGLTDVEYTASTWCFTTPEDRDWWGGTWASRATESAVAAVAIDQQVATAAELTECADGWRRWTASDDGWFAVIHGEAIATVH